MNSWLWSLSNALILHLSLSHKSSSIIRVGNSGKILDANGNLRFEVAASLMSLSEHRVLKDASGKVIGQCRKKKTPGFHMTYYLGPMDNEKKYAVKAKG